MKQNQESTLVSYGDFPIQFTPAAIAMAKSAMQEMTDEEGDILRISVKGGGCAGMQYSLTFTNEIDNTDLFTEIDDLKIAIDVFSSTNLKGTEIDYVDGLEGAGFKFNNPYAKRTCGCGSSFS